MATPRPVRKSNTVLGAILGLREVVRLRDELDAWRVRMASNGFGNTPKMQHVLRALGALGRIAQTRSWAKAMHHLRDEPIRGDTVQWTGYTHAFSRPPSRRQQANEIAVRTLAAIDHIRQNRGRVDPSNYALWSSLFDVEADLYALNCIDFPKLWGRVKK